MGEGPKVVSRRARSLALLLSGLLVATGLLLSPYAASPAAAAELLSDGGFENTSGDPLNSPSWTEADSRWGNRPGSPLCRYNYCGTVNGASVPRTGNGWARFGGEGSPANHTASLSQSVTVPRGSARLTYWYRNSQVGSPYSSVLQVQVDGQTVKTHTEGTTPQSSYSEQVVDLTAFADGGSHTLSFVYNHVAAGTNRMLVDDVSLDSTPAVATPTVTSTDPASPAQTTTPRVRGTAEAGSTVTLYAAADCSGTPLGSGSAEDFGTAGVTVTVPADAETRVWARASRPGVVDSLCSTTSVAYTADRTAPSVEVTGTTPASPGRSLTPSVRGTAEAGSTVAVFTSADCAGDPVATGSAADFGGGGLSVGVAEGSSTTFRATSRDAAGNTSACSASSTTYVQDSQAPAPVQLTGVTPASPAPSTTPSVSGSAEAGSTVRLFTTPDCSGAPAGTGPAADLAGGGIAVTVPRDATSTVRATATDAAGNTSECSTSTVTYTNDSTAPAAVTLLALSPASPSTSLDVTITGTADEGAQVRIWASDDCSGTPVATGTAAALAAPGLTVTVPADSSTRFRATAVDPAGNLSGCGSSTLTYVNDRTAPLPPDLSGSAPASPGQDLTPLLRGTAEAGSTVTVYATADCSGAPAATGTAAGLSSPGLEVTVAENSSTTFRATATDAAGNTSGCPATGFTYVHDTTAPDAPVLTTTDPPSPSRETRPRVRGTAPEGTTVRLYTSEDCTGSPAASGPAADLAATGLAVTVSADSRTTFRATARDAAGNTSACSSAGLDYVNDSTAPSVPTVSAVSPNGSSTRPLVTGTAEDGATVTLYTTASCTGDPVGTGTAAAFATDGVAATVTLGSTTVIRARATDVAGNTSGCSTTSVSYTSDLLDGGFEAAVGNPPNSPYWVETDSVSGSPLCLADAPPCGAIDEQTRPRSGQAYAWFGGYPDARQTASLSQFVTLPPPGSGPVLLTLWYKNTTVSAPYDATLRIRLDDRTVRTIVESDAEDATYVPFVVDLTAYADGGNHVLSLVYDGGSPVGVSNMLVDDLSLGTTAAPAVRTTTPTVDAATKPASPAVTTTPKVTGTAEDGSTVRLYDNASCAGADIGRGTAADFASGGITATVAAGSTTTIYAQAAKRDRDDSLCSTTSATYRVLTAPDTTITKAPKAKVKAKKGKKKAKVAFAFSSPTAGATFQCSLDGKAWAACTSGKVWKLKKGKHTFAVRAVANGLVDATPATWTGTVKRRKR